MKAKNLLFRIFCFFFEDLSKMELFIEPTFQHATWVVRNFFDLPQENSFYLDSPEFLFSGESYCLRLYPKLNSTDGDEIAFHVRKLSVTFPGRKVSLKVGYRYRNRIGDEFYNYETVSLKENISYSRSLIEEDRDHDVPDGCFTVLCAIWLREDKTARSSELETAQEVKEQEGFRGHCASLSSRWNSPQMKLSTVSPCIHINLTIPNFYELLREVGNSLTSPEFCFAGDTYSLRFYPNGDTGDTELHLVRLKFTFPERTVYYRVGYGTSNNHAYKNKSESLVGKIGFCFSCSKLEEERDGYEISDTLKVVLFLHLGEQSSAEAGSSEAAQKQSGLPGIQKLQSDFRQLLQKGMESDACIVVCGKEFQVHKNILRARSTAFEALFGHDTAEKDRERVVIDDLDPDSFGVFLEYLYTGDVQDKLSDDNAFGVYMAANKYDVSTLKSECVEHMGRTLSVDSFCEVLTLALRHREEELLQQTTSFFKINLQRIIITAKWQQFNIDNGASVNEFLIRAFVPRTQ